MPIPKKIHYCWFGKHEMPALNKACINTWKAHLSDYEIILWNESNYPINEYTEYHLKKKNWAFVSDFVRLYALYTEGGIYLDTDFEVLKSFNDLLDCSGFLAYQDSTYITNGIAGSAKHNEFYKDCMSHMLTQHKGKSNFQTSPVVTTNVYNSGKYDLIIYASTYFYPYNPHDQEKQIKILMANMITNKTYAIHHWAKSWSCDDNRCPKCDRITNHILFGNLIRFWQKYFNSSFP